MRFSLIKKPQKKPVIYQLNYYGAIVVMLVGLLMNDSFGQVVERVYMNNIRTPQLFMRGDQVSLPIYQINSGSRLELEFDDMEVKYKSYYYTWVLCDYHWKPVNLSVFDYMKGFTQNRITTYRYSSIAFTRYTHYQAFLPDENSMPTRSGNYLLKVYLDGDTSKLAFTKQVLVLEPKADISASIVQPFTPQKYKTHQRVRFNVNIKEANTFSAAQQVKAVILQNNRWDIAQRDIAPTYVRSNILEYNMESTGVFPAGKEWRWLDLRSFRLFSDRVDSGTYNQDLQRFVLKTDQDRQNQRYVYFSDYNGMYNIVTYESINPFWQADYATVEFSFLNPDGGAYAGKDLYLAGKFTNYELTDEWKMKYLAETGKYQCSAYLKQGYYNYTYILVDRKNLADRMELEGNYWETENTYTILLYYKSFSDRNDRLIGCSTINTRMDKPGFSF